MSIDLQFIKETTKKLLEGCSVEAENGIKIFRPDGTGRYSAVWTRDFAYMVEYAGDLMNKDDIYLNLKYIIDHASPEGWITDKVMPDGTGVFWIGRETFPHAPFLDNGPFLIIAAISYLEMLQESEAKKLFAEWNRTLCRGIDWLPVTEDGIIIVTDDDLHVGYGFTDTVNKTGKMAKETLLLWKSLKLLTKWQNICGISSDKYLQWAELIENSFCECFSDDSGMLFSTTGKCHQTDVWASCYMISIGFPVSSEQKKKIAHWLISNYDGIVESGQIRHLPAGEYWESLYLDIEKDTYQNGAFWPVATGWFYDAIKEHNPGLAIKTVEDVLDYFKKYGVYECVCGEYTKLDTYVVSATNVYAAVKNISSVN